jgi:hypothetical protein
VVATDVVHLLRRHRATAVSSHLDELWVDPVGRGETGRVEQVDELRAHENVLVERYGPLFGHDHLCIAADRLQPVTELLSVRHRRAERHHPHMLRKVDDDLLPDGSAEPVGEKVHFVHHDV